MPSWKSGHSMSPATHDCGVVMKKHTLIFGYIFLALPMFDMMTGFLVVRGFMAEGAVGSPSQLGRFLATLILIYANVGTRIPILWLAIFAGLISLETFSAMQHNQIIGLLFGYVSISKFIYMYLLLVTMVRYVEEYGAPLAKYLKYNLNFISLSIIFAFMTGMANSTYGWGFGTKGFFASGNGLGIYLGVATLLLLGMRHYRFYNDVGLLTCILSLTSLLLVGTKTSLIMALTILALMLWLSRMRLFILPVFFAVVFFSWDVIIYQMTMFFDIILDRFRNSDSLLEFVFSGRIDYVAGAFTELFKDDVSILRWLVGGGSFVSFQNPAFISVVDFLETDPFDVLFMYGMLGMIGYFMLIGYGITLHLKRPYLLLSMAMISLHSVFAGHVLFNSMSSTLLIVIIAVGVLQTRFSPRHTPKR